MRKITRMTVMTPAEIQVEDLMRLLETSPGCEVRPSPHSDALCGDPPAAYAILAVAHEPACRQAGEPIFEVWLCEPHLETARAGEIMCGTCDSRAAVIRVAR